MLERFFRRSGQFVSVACSLVIVGCGSGVEDVEESGVVLRSPAERPAGFTEVHTERVTIGELTVTYDKRGQSSTGSLNGAGNSVREIEHIDSTTLDIILKESSLENTLQMRVNRTSETVADELLGVPVVATLRDGAWSCALALGEPSDEQRDELMRLGRGLDAERSVYPAEGVQVGESWDLSLEVSQVLAGSFESTPIRGEGMMEFREITEFEGQECVHLFFDLEYSGSTGDDENQKRISTITMKGEIYRSLDTLVDVSFKGDAQIRITQPLGPEGSMLMTGPMMIVRGSVVEL
jgi:hypothetical protein